MKKMFFMALAAMFFSACDATEIDNSTVKAVDLNRYLGSWYEIAKYDHVFERAESIG
jgi:apolipoprotein D and lipocalin family protein